MNTILANSIAYPTTKTYFTNAHDTLYRAVPLQTESKGNGRFVQNVSKQISREQQTQQQIHACIVLLQKRPVR